MKRIEGGVCAAKGFKATGLEVGIKDNHPGKKDMAMIFADVPCRAAGTFTTNLVKAAPVQWDKKIVSESELVQAVVVNSGIANACTGSQGLDYCREIAEQTGQVAGISAGMVLTASTGVIGQQLPMDKIKKGIDKMMPVLGNTAADDNGYGFQAGRSPN